MIIDTHVHYGRVDPPGHESPNYPAQFPIERALSDAAAAGVDKIIGVATGATGWDNTDVLVGPVKYPDRVIGAFGRFDPYAPGIKERLEAYRSHPKMLGLRITTRTLQKDWLKDRACDEFFAAVQDLDVAVQIFAPFETPELLATARRFPGVRFLVDHMGVRHDSGHDLDNMFRQWNDLCELAKVPNVWVKVSYFPEACYQVEKFPYPTGKRYFRTLYEAAGPSKLIWGGNFPPTLNACTYLQAVEFVTVEADFLNAADKEAILSGNFLKNFVPKER